MRDDSFLLLLLTLASISSCSTLGQIQAAVERMSPSPVVVTTPTPEARP